MRIFKTLINGMLVAAMSLISCEEEDPGHDKITRLMINQSNSLIISATDTSLVFLGYLTDFTPKDYTAINSIKFVVIGGCNQTASQETYKVSLFDLTNQEIISNSTVEFTAGECNVNKYSDNLEKAFPNQRVDLGIIVHGFDAASFWGAYLYVYRD